MNKLIFTIYAAALLLCGFSADLLAQTNAAKPLEVKCEELRKRGDSLFIDVQIRVRGDLVESRSSLTLLPMLTSESQRLGLPSVLLNGKNRHKVYKREIALRNLPDEPHYAVLRASDAAEHVVAYKMSLPWEPWMKDARFMLYQDMCACAGAKEEIAPLSIADKILMAPTQRYEPHVTLVYITPEAEKEKHRAEVGMAYLDFQVGKSNILPDFRNNKEELAKIDKTIFTVVNDKNITPKGLYLKGYASPEGKYESNKRLAENRVKALRDYIGSRNDFKTSFFTIDSEAEDWKTFREKAEADQNIPAKDKVLAIIDSEDNPDKKEAKLRSLSGGSAFRYVLKEIFPSLRRSEYRIDYTVREFTVEEGREIIKTHPNQLSLREMFAVANSYEIGSDDYNKVFDTAVTMYGNDPVANLNAANIAINRKDYAAARRYLSRAGDLPEAIHSLGVLELLEGNLPEAKVLLEKSKNAKIKQAAANLDELNKKQADNDLFDSFSH